MPNLCPAKKGLFRRMRPSLRVAGQPTIAPLTSATSTPSNAGVTLMGQGLRLGIQLIGIVALSRLLGPDAVGIVAMVLAVIAIAAVVGDLGLSLAAIQARELTDAQKTNLHWVNTSLGVIVASVVAGCAPAVGAFYGAPETVPITVWLATVFALNGIAVQFRVELIRNSRFRTLAAVDVAGPACGLAVGLFAAVTGASYWALVAQQIVGAAVAMALAVLLARWRPGMPRRGVEIKGLLRFGAFAFLAQALTALSVNLTTVFVGQSGGNAPAGAYSRAHQLATMPSSQIAAPLTRVVMPKLAAEAANPGAFLEATVRVQRTLMYGIGAPLSLLAGAAPSVTLLALGDQWDASIPLVRILTLAAALNLIGYIFYWLHLATSRTGQLLAIEATSRVVMIGLIIFAARFGAESVAWSAVAGAAILLSSYWIFALPKLGLRFGAMAIATVPPLLCYSLATVVAWATEWLVRSHTSSPALGLAIATVGWLVAAAGAAVMVPAVRRDARRAFDEVKRLARRNSAPLS